MDTLFLLILGIVIFIFVTGTTIFLEVPSFFLLLFITIFVLSFVIPFSKVAPPSQQGWIVWYLCIFGTLLFLLYHFFYIRLPQYKPSPALLSQTVSKPISNITSHHITQETIKSTENDLQNALVNGKPLQDESVRGFDEEMRIRKLQIQQLKEIR